MEKEKYFVPDIEDIRVGYEAEVNWEYYRNPDRTKSLTPDGWKSVTFKGVDEAVRKYHSLGMYRVPYLSKEQIEEEGWEYKQTNKIRYWYEKESPEIGGNWYGYYIYKAKLIHDPEMKYLKILFSFDAVEDECVFEGECKDINTLKQIQKLLHI